MWRGRGACGGREKKTMMHGRPHIMIIQMKDGDGDKIVGGWWGGLN